MTPQDQTSFTQDQEALQPPPGTDAAKPIEGTPKPKRPQKLYLIIAGASLAVLILIIFIITQVIAPGNNSIIRPPINITPPKDSTTTEFGIRLQDLRQTVEDADPDIVDVDPPALDYKLRL